MTHSYKDLFLTLRYKIMATTKTGFCNGSDMLLYVGGKAIGSCTSHSTTFSSETKERAVKPVATASLTSGLWKKKGIVGLSVSVSAEGLIFYNETECGFADLLGMWKLGKSIEIKCMERENSDKPYLAGKFVIASIERTDPAQDDSTYSISLENDGEPTTLDETAITETPEA